MTFRQIYKRWQYTKPIATHGGIKLRSGRGRFIASNWWSQHWLNLLESAMDGSRLARGRTYARKGQVVDISIEPGLVTAFVQGSRKKPYQVRLGFETVSDEARSLLLLRFREHASFAARLLAREMPTEMEEAFIEAGAPLFPSKDAIRKFKCTCPDEEAPCKHIIAVLLILAEVIDDDPFLLLKLRGLDRDRLINLLTAETTPQETCAEEWDDVEFDSDIPDIAGGSDIADERLVIPSREADLSRWYSSELPVFSYSENDGRRQAAALEMMNSFPFWRGEQPFRQTMAQLYDRAADAALEILTGEKKRAVGRPKKLL